MGLRSQGDQYGPTDKVRYVEHLGTGTCNMACRLWHVDHMATKHSYMCRSLSIRLHGTELQLS